MSLSFQSQIQEQERLLSASITLATADEILRLFDTYREAAVAIVQALREEPWGARTFIVSDLDGNLILFASPA